MARNQVCLKYNQLDEGLLEGERESFSSYPNSTYKYIGQRKSQSQGTDQENSNSPFISLEWKPEDCWLLLWFNH